MGEVIEAAPAKPRPTLRWPDMAALIVSGPTGMELTRRLEEDFPAARRVDTFLAIGVAALLFHSELTVADTELAILRRVTGMELSE